MSSTHGHRFTDTAEPSSSAAFRNLTLSSLLEAKRFSFAEVTDFVFSSFNTRWLSLRRPLVVSTHAGRGVQHLPGSGLQ